jgi:hypothetical protein
MPYLYYIHCPHLFALQKFLFQGTSDEPRVRFGIEHPSISWFKVGFTFSAYHALKAIFGSGLFCMPPDSLTPPQLRQNWSVFAEVIMAEAAEANLTYHVFSICFFSNGRHPANSLTNSEHVHQDDC